MCPPPVNVSWDTTLKSLWAVRRTICFTRMTWSKPRSSFFRRKADLDQILESLRLSSNR